ncbi:hypothetical protein [Streptomyces fuscichromogenes]|uniref:Uncharacterized protein n=1 Tax=Streptomyces fuscichromogenes TaxID=1324013 RepID=A0A917XJN8_9ACTN|nr:hypothetical protein [Streptomyces fuscichromogenes]GGN32939.1 hypothetical protein GCM10011578_072190 [Streptomyces fuscichromogenes]
MDERSRPGAEGSMTTGPDQGAGNRAGVLGTALAGVLAFALSSGSWQWFSTYLGVTLLALILSFARPPALTPGARSEYVRSLTAYSLVVGLCVALAVAPAMQRWSWFFPMPATRTKCAHVGSYAALQAQAALSDLGSHDSPALAYAQSDQSQHAVNDCLASTTTLWLPVYGLAAALLAALGAWLVSRTGTRRTIAGER